MSINNNLVTSMNGLQFIEKWEGCVLTPYKDVAGLRTIGIGYLIKPTDNFPDGVAITKEKAYDLLREEVKKCEDSIKRNIKVKLTQNMFDALVSFGFNCGVGVYSNSGVARETNAGNFAGVPERLLDWCKATINGKKEIVPGLYNRRKDEGELFLLGSGVSPVWSPEMQATMAALGVPWTKASLSDAQTKLKKLGLYTSNVDGVWGPGTSKGLTTFAGQKNIKVGDLSKGAPQALLDELKKV
jgi:lysozyme